MQTWAKRGLQTALVTGGLLMLGTGIASADEDVNPDKPASPLDGSVNVPVHIDNNPVGSPLGSHTVPTVHKDAKISAADLSGAVPAGKVVPTGKVMPVSDPLTSQAKLTALGAAAPVGDKVQGVVPSLTGGARDQAAPLATKTQPVTDRVAGLPGGDKLGNAPSLDDKVDVPAIDARDGELLSGNRINIDLVVPVDVSGNAIAILGKAEATNDSSQCYGQDRDVETSGAGGLISGNVVDLDWALPVQVTNNAIAVGGKAVADGTSSQAAWATGDIVTDGTRSVLGGNVVAPQFATPVQADGNAIAALGLAEAASEADTCAEAGGFILTSGEDSVAGGNAVPVPVAVPVKANGNAIMALGESVAMADSSAHAIAGATRSGTYGVPTYAETDGQSALAGGNIVDPSLSGPVLLCGNAGGAGGLADAVCDTTTQSTAGGTNRSNGEDSVLSGAIAAAPIVLPVQGWGNAVPAVGTANADAGNTVAATSGGDSYTRGHDSVLSGTAASVSDASPVDLFANSVTAVGDANGVADNIADYTSGGNTGTTGDNSVGGGNMGTVPVALPGEVIGNTGAVAGTADATGSEVKTTTSGGGSNTDDDNGLAASNLVNAPVATAAQVFGNGAGALGTTDTQSKLINEVTAGGDSKATGTAGLGSGNIAQAPVSLPAQVFGTGASALAMGTQSVVNEMDAESGGDAMSDGAGGLGGGNVVSAPAGGAGQVFGESVAALGTNDALACSTTETDAGGDTVTSGESGTAAGNVVSPLAMPVVQSFAAVVSGVGGQNSSTATNESDAESGGDIDTNGDWGFISGNLVDVPAAGVVQPFGDAVAAVASESYASGISDTEGEVGGTSTTSDAGSSSLSGIDATLPVGVDAPVYDVPVEVLAQAMTESANNSDLTVGEGEPQVNLPMSGGILPTEVPSFMRAIPRSHDPVQGTFSGVLTGFTDGLTGVPGQEVGGLPTHVGDLPNVVSGNALTQPQADILSAPAILPVPAARAETGDLTGGLTGGLLGGLLGGGGLPVNGLSGGLPLGGARELPRQPALGQMLSVVNLSEFGGFNGQRTQDESPLEYAPVFGDLADVTTIIPAVPASDDLTDVTAVLPVIPAAPVSADLPVTQGVSPRTGESTLDSTRAALANLFATHPIA
jgi:trimeric autotransporter adhesin